MKKTSVLRFAGVFFIVILLIGFTFTNISCKKQEKVIKIGAILPLTGSASVIGEWQRKGIQLATTEVNEKGGIEGKQVKIIFEDSKLDPKEALNAFNKIHATTKAPVVFSCGSAVSNALLPVIDENKTVMLMIAVSLSGIADKSLYGFRFNVGSDDEAKVAVKFFTQKLKINTLAVIFINDEFGLGAYEVIKRNFENQGGKILYAEAYDNQTTDFRTQLSQVKSLSPDVLYVIGYSKTSALAIKQAREMELKSVIMANMALTVPVYRKIIGEETEGIYYTTNLFDPITKDPKVKKFISSYQKKFDSEPSFFSAFAYDAAHILFQAIENKGYSNAKIQAGLLEIKDFPGVIGTTSILPNGDVEYPVRVVKFEKENLVEVFK